MPRAQGCCACDFAATVAAGGQPPTIEDVNQCQGLHIRLFVSCVYVPSSVQLSCEEYDSLVTCSFQNIASTSAIGGELIMETLSSRLDDRDTADDAYYESHEDDHEQTLDRDEEPGNKCFPLRRCC